MPPPMISTSGVCPSKALSLIFGSRSFCGLTSSHRISLTTWVVLYFWAASPQASTTSAQVERCPVSTMHPPDKAAVTAPEKRFCSRRLIDAMFNQIRPFDMSVIQPTRYKIMIHHRKEIVNVDQNFFNSILLFRQSIKRMRRFGTE